MKLIKNQKGFGIIEVLLAIIALALISGVSYYVYNSQKKEDNKLQDSTSAQQTSSTQSTESQSPVEYFEFKELGIKIPLNKELTGLKYQKQDGVFYLMDDRVTVQQQKCDPNSEFNDIVSRSFAALIKGDGTYPKNPDIGDGVLLKQFDDFYISASYPNGPPCTSESSDILNAYVQALSNSKKSLSEAVKKAQKI